MVRVALATVVACCLGISAAVADDVADFYRGKRMTMLISGPAGSGYDLYARLLAQNLPRHIPGNPTIVSQNMPAAAGLVLLNTAYNTGARDGTLLFTLHFNLPLYQAMGGRGIQFDIAKLIGLGRLLASNAVIGVHRDSKTGVKTLEDAKRVVTTIGSTGASSNATVYPSIMNNLVGTKFKVINGYNGQTGVFLAMERGEIDGFGSFSYLTFKSVKPDWLENKVFYPLVQWGETREDAWPDVPTAIDVAQTPADKRAMELASVGSDVGFSYFMPPDVPAPRVAALRKAFENMIVDPAFLAEAEKSNAPLRTASGEHMEEMVRRVLSAPPEVIERLTQLMVANGGVRCEDYTKAEFCAKAAESAATESK
ncbi:MAG: Bug family tripartite tricarboxylate transporter substrate binding protein [Gemmatimonas sp.]